MGSFFSFDPSSLLSFISTTSQDVMSSLYGVVGQVGNAAFGGISSIWDSLGSVFSWLGDIFSKLWDWIQNAVHWILHTLLPAIQAWINRIRAALQKLLKPIIDYIKWEKSWLDMMYNQVIKPLMNFLQRIRSILVIFRLMGMKWATALDQYIASLEQRINSAFLQLRSDVNQIGNWINYIVDPTGLFRVYPFLMSAITSASQLWAVVNNAPAIIIGAADQQANQAAAAAGQRSNVIAAIQGLSNGLTADDLARQDDIIARFNADGWNVGG